MAWQNPHKTATTREGADITRALGNLSQYLGAWQPFPGFDVFFATGVYTRGNATSWAEFTIVGDVCLFRFDYVLGSTTSWPAAPLFFKLPALPRPTSTGQSWNLGRVFVDDASAGISTAGDLYAQNSFGQVAGAFGPPAQFQAAGNQMFAAWQHGGAAPLNGWPLMVGGNRTNFAQNDRLHGSAVYPIRP